MPVLVSKSGTLSLWAGYAAVKPGVMVRVWVRRETRNHLEGYMSVGS